MHKQNEQVQIGRLRIDYTARSQDGKEYKHCVVHQIAGLIRVDQVRIDDRVALQDASNFELTEEMRKRLSGDSRA